MTTSENRRARRARLLLVAGALVLSTCARKESGTAGPRDTGHLDGIGERTASITVCGTPNCYCDGQNPSFKACDDNNACTTDSCANNQCQFTPVADGSACPDYTPSDCYSPSCSSGTCNQTATIRPSSYVCGYRDGPCNATDTSYCNGTSGTCPVQYLSGTTCDDGWACTTGNTCTGSGSQCGSWIAACNATADGCCPSGCTLDNDPDCQDYPARSFGENDPTHPLGGYLTSLVAMAAAPNGAVSIGGNFANNVTFGGSPINTWSSGRDPNWWLSSPNLNFPEHFIASFNRSGTLAWQARIEATEYDANAVVDLTMDANGNTIATGNLLGSKCFDSWHSTCGYFGAWDGSCWVDKDGFLVKYTPNGTVSWMKVLGAVNSQCTSENINCHVSNTAPVNEHPDSIVTDSSGNILMVGDWYLWTWKSYSDTTWPAPYPPPHVLNVGGADLPIGPGTNIFLAKFSGASGSHLWSKSFSTTTTGTVLSPYTAATDIAGDLYIVGAFSGTVDLGGGPLTSGSPTGYSDLFLAKFRGSDGAHLWSKSFPGSKNGCGSALNLCDRHGRHLATDSNGDILLFADSFSASVDLGGGALVDAGETDSTLDASVLVAKFRGSDGSHIWSRRYYGQSPTTCDRNVISNGLAAASNGHLYLTGSFGANELNIAGQATLTNATPRCNPSGAKRIGEDGFVIEIDGATGDYVQAKRFGGYSSLTNPPWNGESPTISKGIAVGGGSVFVGGDILAKADLFGTMVTTRGAYLPGVATQPDVFLTAVPGMGPPDTCVPKKCTDYNGQCGIIVESNCGAELACQCLADGGECEDDDDCGSGHCVRGICQHAECFDYSIVEWDCP